MMKTAVLLVNLGTPDSPDRDSVKVYLKEFLSDPRVIDMPRWKWLPVLHGIILRTRPKKSAKLYRSIWTDEGSSLRIISEKQKSALQKRIACDGICVSLAMTYGNPSISSELEKLHKQGIRKLIVLPLFPQYSSTTTASVWDRVQKSISGWRDIPEVHFIRDYPEHPDYINVLKKKIVEASRKKGEPEVLVVSYHGIPKRYADTGDDYPEQCRATTKALQKLIPEYTIIESYQSKFGKEEWLAPSTSSTLRQLAQTGKKHVHVIAPAFTADCLETLEELDHENRQVFLDAGGQDYTYIEAPNDDPLFIDCLEDLVRPYITMTDSSLTHVDSSVPMEESLEANQRSAMFT